MSKVGVFVDTSDLYHKVQRKFGRGSKVCYEAYYLDCIVPDQPDNDIDLAIAYGMQGDTYSFPNCLNIAGFETKFKPPRVYTLGDREIKTCDWNVTLTLDVVEWVLKNCLEYTLTTQSPGKNVTTVNTVDSTIIIGSSNSLLIPLVKWVQEQGVKVVIFASCIPQGLKEIADNVIEIDENYLEMEEVTN